MDKAERLGQAQVTHEPSWLIKNVNFGLPIPNPTTQTTNSAFLEHILDYLLGSNFCSSKYM